MQGKHYSFPSTSPPQSLSRFAQTIYYIQTSFSKLSDSQRTDLNFESQIVTIIKKISNWCTDCVRLKNLKITHVPPFHLQHIEAYPPSGSHPKCGSAPTFFNLVHIYSDNWLGAVVLLGHNYLCSHVLGALNCSIKDSPIVSPPPPKKNHQQRTSLPSAQSIYETKLYSSKNP